MWNKPTKKRLDKIPRMYETGSIPLEEKKIYLHFFFGGCDWYAVEFDGEDTFFGYAILNGDEQNAEWGYFSLRELSGINLGGFQVDCEKETFWRTRPAKEVEKISNAMGWKYAKKAQDPEEAEADAEKPIFVR